MRPPTLAVPWPPGLRLTESAPTLTEEAVSDKAWSEFGQGDYDTAQWHRACALHTHGSGTPDTKAGCKLPYKEPDGTINRNGVHAAAARIGQTDATGEQKKAAARTLIRAYGQLDEDPPESLTAMTESTGPPADPAGAARTDRLREVRGLSITEAPVDQNGSMTVDLIVIESGWNVGNVRFYPPEVLARDIPVIYPAGTHMHIDHPTATEEQERPERSLATLAAVFLEAPRPVDGGRQMRARARVFAPYQQFVREAWPYIGVSINGWGTGELGEREGRTGVVITELTGGDSVDFVTRPGAGGRITSLLESAGRAAATRKGLQATAREARNVGVWLESRLHTALTVMADDMYGNGRLTRAERITLSGALGDALTAYVARIEADAPQLYQRDIWDDPEPTTVDTDTAEGASDARQRSREAPTDDTRAALTAALTAAHGGENTYVWVRDFDPAAGTVWYDVGSADGTATWEQSYTAGDDGPALSDDRREVRARTVYEPVDSDGDGDGDTDSTESAAPPTAPPTDVTDGAAPAAPTNPTAGEEPPMTGSNPTSGGTGATSATLSAEARAEIAEARARESQAQITTLQQQVATLTVERDTARTEMSRMRAAEAARSAATTALEATDLPGPARARVIEAVARDVPCREDGTVNTDALSTRVTSLIEGERTYIASVREAGGAGTPTGLGPTPGTGNATAVPDWRAQIESRFAQGFGLTKEAATAAANR